MALTVKELAELIIPPSTKPQTDTSKLPRCDYCHEPIEDEPTVVEGNFFHDSIDCVLSFAIEKQPICNPGKFR